MKTKTKTLKAVMPPLGFGALSFGARIQSAITQSPESSINMIKTFNEVQVIDNLKLLVLAHF